MQNNLRWELPVATLEAWDRTIQAKANDENTLNIYDVIGHDYWTGEGMTAKIVSSVLRKAAGAAVTVNINSPGGDAFEGITIYNLLRDYEGDVKVRVLGLAGSAASIIALAGDTVEVARSGFFFIHNAWSIAVGNQHDFKKGLNLLSKLDGSMAEIYATHADLDKDACFELMNEDTWLTAQESIDQGFANSFMYENDVEEVEEDKNVSALRKIDLQLAKSGMSRSERRNLLKDLSSSGDNGTPSATEPTPSAGIEEALMGLQKTLTN